MTFKPFDVVVVPFPFTDIKANKRRPALILSSDAKFNKKSGHAVLAMITSQKNPGWPLDIPIRGNARAGLKAPSKVRMKLFTLDTRLMVKKIGKLTTTDKEAVVQALRSLLAGFFFFAFWLFRAFVMEFGSEVWKLDPRLLLIGGMVLNCKHLLQY